MDGSDRSSTSASGANLYEKKRKQQNREAQRRFRQRNQQSEGKRLDGNAEDAAATATPLKAEHELATPNDQAFTTFAGNGQQGDFDAYSMPGTWQFCSGPMQTAGSTSFMYPKDTSTMTSTDLGFMSTSSDSNDPNLFGGAGIDWSNFGQTQSAMNGNQYWMPPQPMVAGQQGNRRPSSTMRSKTTPSSVCSPQLQRQVLDKQRGSSDPTHRRSSTRKGSVSTSDPSTDRSGSTSNLPESHTRMSVRVDKLCEELSNLYRFGVDMQLLSGDMQLSNALDEVRSRFQSSIRRAVDDDSEMQDSSGDSV